MIWIGTSALPMIIGKIEANRDPKGPSLYELSTSCVEVVFGCHQSPKHHLMLVRLYIEVCF